MTGLKEDWFNLVKLIKKPEEIMERRLSRRGYNLEDCRKMLDNAGGGIVIFNKRSLRSCSLKDFVDVKSC
jgi:hypothetical protein